MDVSTASLEDLIAKLFIARTDVKAYQAGPGPYCGQYFTHTLGRREDENYLPWTRAAIQEHLAGQATYGHYLLNQDSYAKLFAFDIDIAKECSLPGIPAPEAPGPDDIGDWAASFSLRNGREAWANRADPARDYIKMAMRSLAHELERGVSDLGIPTAVAYTGSKGLHVYGFTGLMPADEVREAAMLAIENLPIEATRGKMIYEWGGGTFTEREIFTIEVFPKQDKISNEGGFGNLMRLPLGRNQKSNDPTFFIDEVPPLGVLQPIDPTAKLRSVLERLQA